VILLWDYPADRTNIVFEVWHTHSLTSAKWELAGETTNLFWPFEPNKEAEFFIVRARDTVTGAVSEWNK
jgi:hypothetical protein